MESTRSKLESAGSGVGFMNIHSQPLHTWPFSTTCTVDWGESTHWNKDCSVCMGCTRVLENIILASLPQYWCNHCPAVSCHIFHAQYWGQVHKHACISSLIPNTRASQACCDYCKTEPFYRCKVLPIFPFPFAYVLRSLLESFQKSANLYFRENCKAVPVLN
jgi:hypothetical protein